MKNPIKPNFKTEIIPLLFIFISLIASFFFYSKFPDRVITHWNLAGEANGWSSKVFAAFFFPGMMIFIYLLFLLLPNIDPEKNRYAEFRDVYHKFKAMFIVFFTIIYFVASFSNIGFDLNIKMIIPGLVGIMFLMIGNYLGEVKRNWFLGIRTPWTLSSDNAWNKTNRFGGKVFMIMGVFMIILGFLSVKFFSIVFISFFTILLLTTFIYSYIIYSRE